MRLKRFYALIFCFCTGIIIVITLQLFANSNGLIKGDFIRYFPAQPLGKVNIFPLRYNSYFICGNGIKDVYIGNFTSPLYFFQVSDDLREIDSSKITIHGDTNCIGPSLRLQVDSPIFYISEGQTPAVFKGVIGINKANRFKESIPQFNYFLSVNETRFALRTYIKELHQNILEFIKTPATDISKRYILKKQADGIFDVDGCLLRDVTNGKIIYLYYYRNSYVCLDSNFNVIKEAHTIDTLTTAQIKTGFIKSDNTTQMARPPLTVNKRGCAYGDKLYINSWIISRKEMDEAFKNNSVIDVYSLTNFKYQYSFYIPNMHFSKIKSFQVVKGYVVVIYEHCVASYKMNYL